jgi:hypothetical protein
MKVFQVSNCDTVAAETLEQAVREYSENKLGCQYQPEDLEEEFEGPHEITEEQLKRMSFWDEDSGWRGSMWEWLQQLIERNQKFPCLFGCSEI